MGHIFENKDEAIWSPSRDVALCFLAQAHHLEERLEMASGLIEVMSDTIDINCDQLSAFLARIGSWANLDNPSMQLLLRGVVVHLLALLLSVTTLPESLQAFYPSEWLNEARNFSQRVMALRHGQ